MVFLDSYCCGSLLPTYELENFQIVAESALSVQVINTASAQVGFHAAYP